MRIFKRSSFLCRVKYSTIACAVLLAQVLFMKYGDKIISDFTMEPSNNYVDEKIISRRVNFSSVMNFEPLVQQYFPAAPSKIQRSSVSSSETYFEPQVQHDFPTASSNIQRIPSIIHQTYKDENIPVQFEKYIRTLVEKNPNWTYYLWTDESATKLVSERFPQLLPMWHGYKTPINRADAIRYIVLYEFGGFYGDLDVECGRPLDNLTMKYSCIIPPEPFEQSVFRLHVPYLLNNAIMLCRPKHPFMKHMIDSLHQYTFMLEQIDIAGPSFVTSQFIRYNNITADDIYKIKQSNESNSPYFYKGNLLEDDIDAVYVPNTQYFINSLSQDWMNEKHYKKICAYQKAEGIIVTKACSELERRLSQKHRNRYAFTEHHWYKSYTQVKQKKLKETKPLSQIVGQFKIY